MSWIRWECQTPDHIVVARLAEALKVRRAEALGLFNGVCCRLGDHRPDGDIDLLPDTALETWGQWEGRKGRFAAAFRELCVERREGQDDPVGVIKGWWRQRALLDKQARDAAKRKPPRTEPETPEEPPENPRGFMEGTPAGSWGNVDVDGNELRTTTAQSVGPAAEPPAPEGSDVAKLLTGMGRTVDRWAVFNFLERVPERDLKPWVARLAAYLEGVDLPPGMRPTPAQLATACRDYAGNFSAAHFRGFIRRVIEGPRNGRPSPRDRTAATLTAVERFVKGGPHARP